MVMKKTASKPSLMSRNRTVPALHVTHGDSSSRFYLSSSQDDVILTFIIIMAVLDVYDLILMSSFLSNMKISSMCLHYM